MKYFGGVITRSDQVMNAMVLSSLQGRGMQ
jgi:hypothetical protein